MKKLTMKNIALGLALAGYAASSAYAIDATTTKTIQGDAPVIKSVAGVDNKFTVKVMRTIAGTETDVSTLSTAADRQVRTGDKVVITFKYADENEDEAITSLIGHGRANPVTPADELEFFLTLTKSGTTTKIATGLTEDVAVTKTATGEYSYIIPGSAQGSDLGINLAPVSQYGDPWFGTLIKGTDLFAIGENGGGGTTTPPTGPILPGDSFVVGIFKTADVTSGTPAVGVTPLGVTSGSTSTEYLQLGQTYAAAAWEDSTANGKFDTGEEVASIATYQWSVTGGNSAALGSAASTDLILAGATSATIALPATNAAAVTAWPTLPAAEAGLQGFQLKVSVTF